MERLASMSNNKGMFISLRGLGEAALLFAECPETDGRLRGLNQDSTVDEGVEE